jgi:hypothetical protein
VAIKRKIYLRKKLYLRKYFFVAFFINLLYDGTNRIFLYDAGWKSDATEGVTLSGVCKNEDS